MSLASKKEQPQNAGTPWTFELDNEFIELIANGTTNKQCADHFGRTEGSIHARKLHHARSMIRSGKTLEEVSSLMKISVYSIQQSLRASEVSLENAKKIRDKPKQTKITEVFPPETDLSVLKEIRDALKKIDKRLNVLEKNGKEEPVYLDEDKPMIGTRSVAGGYYI